MFQHIKRIAGRFCCLLMAMLLCIPVISIANEIEPAQERSPLIRVCLTKLGLTDRLDLTLTAPYQLSTDVEMLLYFQANTELSFQLKNDFIYLYYQGMALRLGRSVDMKRSGDSYDQRVGFYRTHFPALYLGDLRLEIVEGKLRPVLTIHVEDYLLGVVPYEMSDTFPLEALKAQAVAARTYALRSQNQYDDFDVYDNTNDQVFKGYISEHPNSEQAILETQGICGFYKEKLAQCFYSASNGGQTELVQTVWPTRGEYPYYTFGPDPYDLENLESTVRSFALRKSYQADETAPYALRKLLSEKLTAVLTENGYDPSPDSIQVNAVQEVSIDSPNMNGSKLMTMLHIALDISVRTKQEVSIRIADTDLEEVSLFSNAVVLPWQTQATQPEYTELQNVSYGPFVTWHETVWLDIPIFPEAEDVFGMDISGNYDNEIWSVAENDEAFTLEARRYGHGVGMSQRGAQVMASRYGMTYQDILGFYYPGMKLRQYQNNIRRFAKVDEALSATAGPAPSPTPRPTLMPSTMVALEDQWFAYVTEIADDSSLNLRSIPSMNGDIQMRLYKNQRLLVIERCPEEGWVHVKTDVAEGYVMEKYLTKEER